MENAAYDNEMEEAGNENRDVTNDNEKEGSAADGEGRITSKLLSYLKEQDISNETHSIPTATALPTITTELYEEDEESDGAGNEDEDDDDDDEEEEDVEEEDSRSDQDDNEYENQKQQHETKQVNDLPTTAKTTKTQHHQEIPRITLQSENVENQEDDDDDDDDDDVFDIPTADITSVSRQQPKHQSLNNNTSPQLLRGVDGEEALSKNLQGREGRFDASNQPSHNNAPHLLQGGEGRYDVRADEIVLQTFDENGMRIGGDPIERRERRRPDLHLEKLQLDDVHDQRDDNEDKERQKPKKKKMKCLSFGECYDMLEYNDLYIRRNWDGRMKVVQCVASFFAFVLLPTSYTYYHPRYIFHRFIAGMCFFGTLLDLLLHLSSLWRALPRFLRSSMLLMVLCFIAAISILTSSCLIVVIANVNPDEKESLASSLLGYIAMVFFGIETTLHFLRYRTELPFQQNPY